MKKFLLLLFLLLIMGVAYMTGQKGTDPTQWFLPPTPTPAFTTTPTATAINTSTATSTSTSTVTATPTATVTPVPKKKTKKHSRPQHEIEATEDEPVKKPVLQPPLLNAPEAKPICNSSTLIHAMAEVEPNNTFTNSQNLGDLTTAGLQVNGSVEKVAGITTLAEADAFKVDPIGETSALDLDVYNFTSSTPFLVVLDCYSPVMGRPDPLYDQKNYRVEVHDEAFQMIGSSYINDPVQAVEISQTAKTYYVVVYGVYGKPGNYRLTITRKETN